MTFFIQASSPIVGSDVQATEDDLREAIEDVFVIDTEDAIMNWNGVSIALSYKYDISVIVDDLIDMLLAVKSSGFGEHQVNWPSNTFHATWRIAWDERELRCAATWYSISGGVEDLLERTGGIRLTREEFLAEWKVLLERVVAGLKEVGYCPKSVAGLDQLEQLIIQLARPGRLYRVPRPPRPQ